MRIRTVKPEFFHHFALFKAEQESGLPLRVAYIGLWCAADREGRFKWEPESLGAKILPFDKLEFSRVLDALATRGWILKYDAKGGEFGFIPTFKSHQVINNRENASKLPPPPRNKQSHGEDESLTDASGTREPRVNHASSTREPRDAEDEKFSLRGKEGNMEGEGKGKEREQLYAKPEKIEDQQPEEAFDNTPDTNILPHPSKPTPPDEEAKRRDRLVTFIFAAFAQKTSDQALRAKFCKPTVDERESVLRELLAWPQLAPSDITEALKWVSEPANSFWAQSASTPIGLMKNLTKIKGRIASAPEDEKWTFLDGSDGKPPRPK